ncbi:MAG: hypothetical protein SH850_20865 [Planctomycetaceae bacterium]|nr:hypothetical protein [Planctomycetaceae bacterium]
MRQFVTGLCFAGLLLGAPLNSERGQCRAEPPRGERPKTGPNPQQQNLAKLKSDLTAIREKSEVTKAQKQAVAQDLQAIFAVANRPSPESVQKLADDLTQALSDGKITTAESLALTQAISAVLASANISQEAAQKLKADVQTLLKASHLTPADIQTLQQDIQAILQTAQENRPNAKTKK